MKFDGKEYRLRKCCNSLYHASFVGQSRAFCGADLIIPTAANISDSSVRHIKPMCKKCRKFFDQAKERQSDE